MPERRRRHLRPHQAVRAPGRGRLPRPASSRPGRSTASSAPTARARRPRSGCCSDWSGPTSGSVELLGRAMPADGPDVLARVGALVEGPAFHPYLSGRDNLARLEAADRTTDPRTARARIDGALDRVGLLVAATKRYRAYSLGMRQRLAIASALLRQRDLLVLDEPTNGLDPQGTREVRTLVGSLADEGATVLVSSHLLSEVEQMCSHLGVMHAGQAGRPGHQRRGQGGHRGPRRSSRRTSLTRRPASCASSGCTDGAHRHISATGSSEQDLAGQDRRCLRPPGCARPRLPGRRPVARGRLRLAHRGGLRCQWLTGSRHRQPRTALHQVPALRAAVDLRSAPQPRRVAGAGSRSRAHRRSR